MRYVTIKNVKAGMEIARPLLDEKGNVLLNRGNKLSPVVYNRIMNMEVQGLYVEDEISRGIEIESLIAPDLKRNAIKALMNNDVNKAISYAYEIVNDLKRKESLQVNIIDIKNNKNYTYKHCVSCCIYSVIVGLALGLTEDQLKNLAVAAMLHDIGKFELPESLLHKKSKLTADEMQQMRQHPRIAYDKLTAVHEISSVARNAILYHHENVDGTGYNGVLGDKQTIITKILHLVDVYDSMTSVRKYREAYSPSEAIEYIMGNVGKMFDAEVVAAFTSKFPLYPIGTTIRLSNNEQAIIYSNEVNNIRPVIRTMQDKLVDLSTDIEYRNVIILGLD